MKYLYAIGLFAAFIAVTFAIKNEAPLDEVMLYSALGLASSALLKIEQLENRIKKIGG